MTMEEIREGKAIIEQAEFPNIDDGFFRFVNNLPPTAKAIISKAMFYHSLRWGGSMEIYDIPSDKKCEELFVEDFEYDFVVTYKETTMEATDQGYWEEQKLITVRSGSYH